MLWFLRIKNAVSKIMHSSVSHYLILMKLLFPTMGCSSLTDSALIWCALTHRTDVYHVWIRDTGSEKHSGHYHNYRLHSVMSGLWVLACVRRAD